MDHGDKAGRGKKPPQTQTREAHDPRQSGIRRNMFFRITQYMAHEDFNLHIQIRLFEYTVPRRPLTPTMTETASFPHSPPSRNPAPAPLRISKANCTDLELESWSVNLIPMAPSQKGMACCCGPIITQQRLTCVDEPNPTSIPLDFIYQIAVRLYHIGSCGFLFSCLSF